MSGQRPKLPDKQCGRIVQFTNPHTKQSFFKDDNDFPSLSTNERKYSIGSKSTEFASGTSSSYSAKLKAPRTSHEVVFLQSENPNEETIHDHYSKRSKGKQASKSLLFDEVRQSSSKNIRKHCDNYPTTPLTEMKTKHISESKLSNFKSSPNKYSFNEDSFNNNPHSTRNFRIEDTTAGHRVDPTPGKALQINQHSGISLGINKNAENFHKDALEKNNSVKTKKKNRKSKVKRNTALQSGKLFVLTPEAYSRILDKTSESYSSSFRNTAVNINDDEEYPELGLAVLQKKFVNNDKSLRNQQGKKLSSINFCTETSSETVEISTKNEKDQSNQIATTLHQLHSPKKTVSEDSKRTKKTAVEDDKPHPPPASITIPFQDMILAKSKKKEAKSTSRESCITDFIKVKSKKAVSYKHNALDSSAPAIKRGKERETPKPKRKSQLKRVILMDRQLRKEQVFSTYQRKIISDPVESQNESLADEFEDHKEQLFSPKSSGETECSDAAFPCTVLEESVQKLSIDETSESLLEQDLAESEIDDSSDTNLDNHLVIIEDGVLAKDDIESNKSIDLELSKAVEENLINQDDIERTVSTDLELNETIDRNLVDHRSVSSSSCLINGDPQTDQSVQTTNEELVTESCSDNYNENSTNSSSCEDALHSVDGESTESKPESVFSEKDKLQAVKIIIHTRSFRSYCTHFSSKEIGSAALALLDDLARFQDRLHQKDPIKARMKRRLVYGIREVTKNIKLKKLKCLIIAADLENVESEGGLNDALARLVTLASDHCVPCVYPLSRKALGKVCHKPVPVSCVGIFNYEGSEANFRKMMELLNQSSKDYSELQKSVLGKLHDTHIENIFKAYKKSSEDLQNLRESILGDFLRAKAKNAIKEEES